MKQAARYEPTWIFGLHPSRNKLPRAPKLDIDGQGNGFVDMRHVVNFVGLLIYVVSMYMMDEEQ